MPIGCFPGLLLAPPPLLQFLAEMMPPPVHDTASSWPACPTWETIPFPALRSAGLHCLSNPPATWQSVSAWRPEVLSASSPALCLDLHIVGAHVSEKNTSVAWSWARCISAAAVCVCVCVRKGVGFHRKDCSMLGPLRGFQIMCPQRPCSVGIRWRQRGCPFLALLSERIWWAWQPWSLGCLDLRCHHWFLLVSAGPPPCVCPSAPLSWTSLSASVPPLLCTPSPRERRVLGSSSTMSLYSGHHGLTQ